MIQLDRLCAGYPGKPVLHDLSPVIPSGSITAILGPNGSGKSTLLKTLCGILSPSQGRITLNGLDTSQLSSQELAKQVAYLAQSHQTPDITVGRLVLHGRFPYLHYPRRYREEDLAIANQAMAQMGILDLKEKALTKLSGGQRQKAYIAMALAQNAPVILLDEPTTYLDIRHQMELMALAKQLQSQGKTIAMVMHDLSLAMAAADQILVLDRGHLVSQGTPEELFASGALETVFGIRLQRVETGSGWHYYYQ